MQNANDFRQAVCESRKSDRIVKYITADKFTINLQTQLDNGNVWGVYYNEDGALVAETRDGDILTNILA